MSKDLLVIKRVIDLLDLPALLIVLSENQSSYSYINNSFANLLSLKDSISKINLHQIFINSKEIENNLIKLKSSKDNDKIDCFTELKLKDSKSLKVKIQLLNLGNQIQLGLITENSVSDNVLHSQRLQTLGMLSGGIAHDFNNVLAGILGHITYLKAVLPKNGKHLESLEAIEEGSNKASLLTREIVNFSKLDENKADYSEISEVISQTTKLLRGALPPKYKILLNLPKEPYVVGLSEANLAQIIVNLIMNARDAIVDQGEITVTVKQVKNDSSEKSNLCLLQVTDNGSGIPEGIIKKICAPYFSTKKDKGNGLGLATVSEIVNKSRGKLEIKSKVGSGTTIEILIPLYGKVVETTEEEPDSDGELLQGSGKILVVDDEDSVRNVVCMSLDHLGYEVVAASSGQEAIDEYKSANFEYELVILDMLMPGLSGEETFYELKKLNSSVKALFISGYTSEVSIDNVLNEGGLGFLQKPFTIEQLAKKVVECI